MKNIFTISSLLFLFFGLFTDSSKLSAGPDSYWINYSDNNTTAFDRSSEVYCNTPTWPSTSNITETTATFSWSSVSGAVSYAVQTRLPGGSWNYAPGSPFYNTSVTVGGFYACTTHEWRVRANCSSGEYSNWTSAVSFTTDCSSSCEAPSWLSTVNITATTATFDWDAVSNATNYSIQWRYPGGTWYDLGGGPWSNTWVNVGGLTPGTDYQWRVRSNCYGGGYSPWSYPESFTTLGNSCDVPTWPSTYNITQTTATVSWSAVSGAQNYSVQTRLPGGSWSYASGSPFYGTSVTLYGLTPGTTYEWRVRANCGYGEYSYWTSPISFTTQGSSNCYHPDWLSTVNITQTSATFDWEPVSGAVSYSVQWRVWGGSWQDLPGGPFYNTWANISGLSPGTTYEWRVRSNCGYGSYSPWSYPEVFTTLVGYSCSIPTWPSTNNITATTAGVSWSNVSGAQSYTVQYRLLNGNWYDAPGSPFYNNSVTITGLSPNTTYQWRVRANCGNGQYSYWTSPITFTTTGGYCAAPYWLYTSNITATSANLVWNDVSGADSYDIQWRYTNGAWNDLQGGPFYGTWVSFTGLTPGTSYQWRVRSNCDYYEESAWSGIASFTTLGYSCSTPTWPSTYNITNTTASFSWSAVSGAVSYTVQTRLPNGSWSDAPGSPFYNTSVTVGGFSPNTTYEWRVRANCGNYQYSNWTYPISFTTTGYYNCEHPTWLNTTSITQSSATFNWDAVNGANSYSVQWRVWGGSWQDLPGGPFYNTWANISGLSPSTTYEWRVRSNCGNYNYSSWSYPEVFTTPGYSCNTPTWPSTNNVTNTTATFSWSSVSGAISYTVQTRLLNGTWTDAPGGPFYNTTVTVTGFSPNTTYEWRVRANCSSWTYSNWTNPIAFTTTGSANCYHPEWLNTTNITSSSATFNWSAVPGAVSYAVQYRIWGGSWIDLPGGAVYNSWVNIYGLVSSTTYEWRVKTYCGNGVYSSWSYPEVFTTLGYACSTPTWPSTSNVTQTTATFSWSSVSGAESYTVQTRLLNGSWGDAPGSPFYNTTVTVGGFSPGTTYEWRVRANCGGGQYSSWTTPVQFTTSGSGGGGGGNDNCANAIQLTVGSSCSYTSGSNINATASTPAPNGGCPTGSYKDVWFRFTMPGGSNPVVTIRTTSGSLSDAVMEVYHGDNCSNLSYITCEDDNINGNGSSMPVINLSGYPSVGIWVRVWGYWGATGTFNICVFDYYSNNLVVPEEISVIPFEGESFELLEVETETVREVISSSLSVTPNPASDVLQVALMQSAETTVSRILMTDMSGKTVLKKEYQSNDVLEFKDQLDIATLTPGIYIIQVVTTKGILTEKVMVVENK